MSKGKSFKLSYVDNYEVAVGKEKGCLLVPDEAVDTFIAEGKICSLCKYFLDLAHGCQRSEETIAHTFDLVTGKIERIHKSLWDERRSIEYDHHHCGYRGQFFEVK